MFRGNGPRQPGVLEERAVTNEQEAQGQKTAQEIDGHEEGEYTPFLSRQN